MKRPIATLVAVAFLLATTSVPSSAAAAGAGGGDAVVMKDGNVIRGTLTEVVPGDHATIMLATGQAAVVKWSYVARIDRGGAPMEQQAQQVQPQRSAQSSAVVVAPRTAAPAASGKVHVHIEAEDADVTLEQQTDTGWAGICGPPCGMELPLDRAYRISGNGIRTSRPFQLAGNAGDHVYLSVSAGSSGGFVGGIVLMSIGLPVLLIGGMTLLVVALIHAVDRTPNTGNAELVGWSMFGGGIAGLVGGIILLTSNARTSVQQSMGAQGQPSSPGRPQGRERVPTWASVGLPIGHTTPVVPIIDLKF